MDLSHYHAFTRDHLAKAKSHRWRCEGYCLELEVDISDEFGSDFMGDFILFAPLGSPEQLTPVLSVNSAQMRWGSTDGGAARFAALSAGSDRALLDFLREWFANGSQGPQVGRLLDRISQAMAERERAELGEVIGGATEPQTAASQNARAPQEMKPPRRV